MSNFLIVFFGAGIGGALRHAVNLAAARWLGFGFPWGTLCVNIVGSFVMGLLVGWLAFKDGATWTQHLRLFLATGILGGFTTFSAFSLDAVLVWERGEKGLAAVYVVSSVVLSLAGLVVCLGLIRTLTA